MGIELHGRHLHVDCDESTGVVTFTRNGVRLPWRIDLQRGAEVTVRQDGTERALPLFLSSLTRRQLAAGHVQWLGDVAGAELAVELKLERGEVEALVLTLTPLGRGQAELVSARWPAVCTGQGVAREVCFATGHQGSLFRADGQPWRGAYDGSRVTMPLSGFTCDGHSVAMIVDTALDARVDLSDDGVAEATAQVMLEPCFGELAYARQVRFVPLADTGHVAIANAYRAYLEAQGRWRPWEARVEENPEVARLKGAFVACAGYFQDAGADQVGAMTAMKQMGFEHGYLFAPKMLFFGWEGPIAGATWNTMSDESLRAIQDLGYLCAPFLQVEETGAELGAHRLVADAAGELVWRWQIREEKYYEIQKWRVPGMLAALEDRLQTGLGVHFDTINSAELIEHYGKHQYDRAGDARSRREVMAYYRARRKLVGTEGLRDWSADLTELTTQKTFCPLNQDRRTWVTPLADLVYHDSLVRVNWEHHSYDDAGCVRTLLEREYHPFGMELNDLLTASPPVLFPEGMLYAYGLEETVDAAGRPALSIRWDRATLYQKRISDPVTQEALPRALRVCQLNARHGTARMIAHRYPEPASPLIQESEFASGLHVIANFGDEPYALADGRVVPARGSLVEE